MIRGSAAFESAVSQSHSPKLTGEVWINNARIGAVPILDGSVSQSGSQFQRRSGSVTLPNTPEVRGLMQPGACLRVWSGIQGVSGKGVPVLWGPIIAPAHKWGGADIDVTVECLSRRVLRDEFTTPTESVTDATVANQILRLWRSSISWCKWEDLSGDATKLPKMVWEGDKGAAITDMASSIGCETWMRPDGTVVLQRIPSIKTWPVMRVESGVSLVDLTLTVDWDEVVNHCIVTSSQGESASVRGEWVDEDSPTGVLQCGRNVKTISSEAIGTNSQARSAAYGVVRRSQGHRVGATYTAVKHPGVEVSDVHTLSAWGETTRRFVADTVSFDLGGTMQVTGRLPSALADFNEVTE